MEQNKQKIIFCKGLPASGKSTWARKWVNKDPENRVQVEKDQIRKNSNLFKGGEYSHKRGDESIVLKERDRLIRQALSEGKDVVSSDTNLAPKHWAKISTIAKEYGAEIEPVSFLDVPLAELIERDKNREDSVGEKVIRRMFHQQVKRMPTFLKHDPKLPWAIVTDFDGTLTRGPKDRSPYDWHKVGNDEPNLGLTHVLDGISLMDYAKLFVFSGRDEVCRPESEEWLDRHCIRYEKLYMRPEGDTRGDDLIKAEMIENHIRGKYNVLIWFDDRPKIVRMLNDVYGINVAAFGDQNYDF